MTGRRLIGRSGFTGGFAAGSLRLAPVVLSVLALLVGLAACAPGAATGGPRLSFEERTHDVGQISAGRPAEYRVAFTNTGTHPLQVDEVRSEPASPGG